MHLGNNAVFRHSLALDLGNAGVDMVENEYMFMTPAH
jgi:hypothetical protein